MDTGNEFFDEKLCEPCFMKAQYIDGGKEERETDTAEREREKENKEIWIGAVAQRKLSNGIRVEL